MLAAIGDQQLRKGRVGHHAGQGLHNGFDLFAQVVVGHAKNGGVGHLRVRDEQVFALLRVDVHATRNDHERAAIGEVQKAVGVKVTHVAHGAHAAVG